MKSTALPIIGIAIVWAAVLLAVGSVLHGTPHATRVIVLIGGGVAATLIILGGSIRKGLARNQ